VTTFAGIAEVSVPGAAPILAVDCRTRRKANIDANNGHRPRVGFWRAIIGLEVAVNIALRLYR
jgi:hypothetical protein